MKMMSKEKGEYEAISQREVYLTHWNEVIGIYNGLKDEGQFLLMMIGEHSVVFPKDSTEAKSAKRQLNREMLKRKIAVLRTDPDTGHLFVRVVEK